MTTSTLYVTRGRRRRRNLRAVLALCLCILHTLACRLIWPHAALTVNGLFELRLAVPIITLLGIAMVCVDFYATFTVGEVDRGLLERYFDQAEYWLRSWVAPVVQVFTLGYVNPRRMVDEEVKKNLTEYQSTLQASLWWVSVPITIW